MSATLMSWNGECSRELTFEQTIKAMDEYGSNEPAAVARLMDLAEQAILKASGARDGEAKRVADHRREILREMLK